MCFLQLQAGRTKMVRQSSIMDDWADNRLIPAHLVFHAAPKWRPCRLRPRPFFAVNPRCRACEGFLEHLRSGRDLVRRCRREWRRCGVQVNADVMQPDRLNEVSNCPFCLFKGRVLIQPKETFGFHDARMGQTGHELVNAVLLFGGRIVRLHPPRARNRRSPCSQVVRR